MGATLVVGDTHLKHELILPRVDGARERACAERVVFLGDYCDEWGSTGRQLLAALELFAGWVENARAAGVRVDLLLGNHDFQYLMGEEGPGTHVPLMEEVAARLRDLGATIAETVDGFLLTHAGLTADWACRHLDAPGDAEEAKAQLNALFERGARRDLRALSSCGRGRGGWDVPGPLWADRSELWEDAYPGIDQIVGHTPVPACERMPPAPAWARTGGEELWLCDTFSLTSRMRPIGDGGMLLVEDGCVEVVAGEDDPAFEPWDEAVAAAGIR
ncbi:metallophosphoesterase [Arabiibacter massiliensis]|uniref:metallophosphoesterase n=1 Tax=Arabiibacter massiliensis TaxID=1870985 RepID=UPI0009BA9226|nr:metallophosphoesterase [Arabiibacter massiliensis]